LTDWLLLPVLIVLDVAALIWLRRAIHLGLLQEAAEHPIEPPITCPNCGHDTPHHTFCIECGVSFQALPKERPQATSPSPEEAPA
jgi:DNA-directed RNA polymerase subunit RPC12/RpoP